MSPKNEVGCFITCGIIKCTEHNIGLKLRVQRMRFFNKIDETLAKVYGEKAKITNTENYYVYETTDLKISLETDGNLVLITYVFKPIESALNDKLQTNVNKYLGIDKDLTPYF